MSDPRRTDRSHICTDRRNGRERLPPGRQCLETDEDAQMLAVFTEATEEAQAMDRSSVQDPAAGLFDAKRVVDADITVLQTGRARWA